MVRKVQLPLAFFLANLSSLKNENVFSRDARRGTLQGVGAMLLQKRMSLSNVFAVEAKSVTTLFSKILEPQTYCESIDHSLHVVS